MVHLLDELRNVPGEIPSFKNKIQTITRLKEADYQQLKNEGYFDRRYIID